MARRPGSQTPHIPPTGEPLCSRFHLWRTRVCERHGVRLNTRKDLSAAWRSCIARVFELSSPKLSPAWATNDPDPEEGPLVEHAPLIAYIGFPVAVYLLATPFF